MSLEEIISTVFEIVITLLFLAMLFSFITSRKNRKAQASKSFSHAIHDSIHQATHNSNSQKVETHYHAITDKNQLEFPFYNDVKQMQISHRDELVKEYFQTRKRYTVVNPPYTKNMRSAANFY